MAKVIETNIESLVPDNKNFNKGTQFGDHLMDESLRRFGLGRSILIGLVFGCLFGVSIGFATGCLAGAIKEWWDSKGHGTVEIMDFIFTAIGALCGACLSIPAIMLYHFIIGIWQR